MKLKLGTLVKCRKTLIKLNRIEGLDSVTAYRILKNSHVIDKELKLYDEQQAKLLHRFCKRDKNGKPVVEKGYYVIKDSNKSKYETEIVKLFDEDVEVPIKEINIESIATAGLSPAQIGSIEFILIVD